MMGGDVDASSSEPGKGSTFTVRLPAVVAPPSRRDGRDAPAPAPPPRRPRTTGEATVLVVDDDPTVRDLLSRFLGRGGLPGAFCGRTARKGSAWPGSCGPPRSPWM